MNPDPKRSPACSIVVRAFNEEAHIGRLLAGIEHQTLQDYEVILVDSGSTDRTLEIAEEAGARVVHIPPEEFTFGRSLNLGISEALGSLIVIASAHVYPIYPDWLEQLLSPFEAGEVALSYGRQSAGPDTRFSEGQYFAHWYPEHSQPRQTHPFCNNANAAIRRDLWVEHPYDEALTGLEDLAWGKWALEQGHAIAYVAEAEIVHVHNEDPKKVYNRFRREAMAFKRIYPEETFSFWDFLRLTSANTASDLRYAARQKALIRNLLPILWFRTMQFAGTFRGYRTSGPVTGPLRQIFYYPRGLHPDNPRPANSTKTKHVEPIRYPERHE